jgi:hypothetical protein
MKPAMANARAEQFLAPGRQPASYRLASPDSLNPKNLPNLLILVDS